LELKGKTLSAEKFGRVRYSPARGVSVREPGNIKNTHSAVSGSIAIYTDTLVETQQIIDCWDEIIQAANAKVEEILSRTEG
jgi:hypothetical protein